MNNSFYESLILPPVYTKSKAEFWNDEYISKQMLKAHLDPESMLKNLQEWDIKLLEQTFRNVLLNLQNNPL